MTTTTATSSSSVATANNAASTTATTDDDDEDDADDGYYQESMAQSIVAYALNIGHDSFYDVKGYHSDNPFDWTAQLLREYSNECNALEYLQDFINDVIVPLEEDAYYLDILEGIRNIFNMDNVISVCNQCPNVGKQSEEKPTIGYSKVVSKNEYGIAISLKMTYYLDHGIGDNETGTYNEQIRRYGELLGAVKDYIHKLLLFDPG